MSTSTVTANPVVAGKPPARRLRKFITRLFVVIVSLVLGALLIVSGLYYHWTRGALPQEDGVLRLSGLSAPATIERDRWGVPHITAANMADAAFAQGYALAQDRLWQMDLLRRAANGELSEVLGAGDNNAQLEIDKLHRSIGLRRAAAKELPKLSPEMQQLLTAYSNGVNAYIESHRDSLPLEFHLLRYQPAAWQPIDCLAVGKLIGLSLTSNWKFDLMRAGLARKLDPNVYAMLFDLRTNYDQPIVGTEPAPANNTAPANNQTSAHYAANIDDRLIAQMRAESTYSDLLLDSNSAMIGSNNWVVSGTRTATGKPILCNDPHQGLTLPAIWYQVHVKVTDGSYHTAGVCIIGAPGIVIGHNDRIAWGATNLMADVQDLYIEEFDPANGHRYRAGTEWRDAEVIKEPIKVRISMVGTETNTIEHEVLITRHGPIVAETEGQKVALRWTGLDPDVDEFTATYQLNRARNWDEFRAALRNYAVPVINYVYADVDGNIGYYGAGRIPIRANGDGSRPYDGRQNDGEWLRYIPFEELPHLYNPPNGWIDTANQQLGGASYPYHLATDWAPPYRAYRINQLLGKMDHCTLDDMHKLHGDVYAIPSQLFAEQTVKLAAAHADDARWRDLQNELKDFDGNLLPESRAALIITFFRNEFTEQFFNYWLGDAVKEYEWYRRAGVIDLAITTRPPAWLPKSYPDYDSMVISCYQKALEKITEKLGADRARWRYGAIHNLSFSHPLGKVPALKPILNAPVVELGGNAHTVNAIDLGANRVWGPSMRMVISLADLDATTQSIVPGESAQPASPHYIDEISDWQYLRPHAFPFNQSAVAPLIEHRLTLQPQ